MHVALRTLARMAISVLRFRILPLKRNWQLATLCRLFRTKAISAADLAERTLCSQSLQE